MGTALSIEQLSKSFHSNKSVLNQINISVNQGEMIALIGASGSGKSTLLRHIAGLISADAHSHSLIKINGECAQINGKVSKNIRQIRTRVGFIFQQFNLVDRLPVLTNVLVGLLHTVPLWRGLLGKFTNTERGQAYEALKRVGIADCFEQRASTLSGGQQQRAAIARTLVQGADLILADEPIASLDPESSRNVMDILSRINREDGSTIIVSLHQVDIAIKYCPRVIALHKGNVVYDGASADLTPALLSELYGVHINELANIAEVTRPVQVIAPSNTLAIEKDLPRMAQVA